MTGFKISRRNFIGSLAASAAVLPLRNHPWIHSLNNTPHTKKTSRELCVCPQRPRLGDACLPSHFNRPPRRKQSMYYRPQKNIKAVRSKREELRRGKNLYGFDLSNSNEKDETDS